MVDVLTAIFAVFTEVGEWIVTAIETMVPLFYADGALTFIGTLSIIGLAFAVCFLVIGLVTKFIQFRGR